MEKDLIVLLIELAILIASFIISKFLTKNSNASNIVNDIVQKTDLVTKYADSFVSWAKQFLSTSSGSEKMDEVVNKLTELAEQLNLEVTETQLRAIAQRAYDSMKAEEIYLNSTMPVINETKDVEEESK